MISSQISNFSPFTVKILDKYVSISSQEEMNKKIDDLVQIVFKKHFFIDVMVFNDMRAKMIIEIIQSSAQVDAHIVESKPGLIHFFLRPKCVDQHEDEAGCLYKNYANGVKEEVQVNSEKNILIFPKKIN